MLQLLIPCMQDHGSGRLLAVLFPKRLVERTPGSAEEQIVQFSSIAKN